MADTDRTRRFRWARLQKTTEDPAAYIDARAGRRAAPPQPTAAQGPRPASVQARQDVVDIAAFIRKVDTERGPGRPAPRAQPMQTILGAFHGSPGTQTTVQILAAAATARHFGGENAAARKWEELAQDNAARLNAMRAQQYRQEQTRYVQAQMPPDDIDRRIRERVTADRETDRRAFDAAGALALSYVAVKSLPPFDKLAELSRAHLTAADPVPASKDVGTETDFKVHEEVAEKATADPGIGLDQCPDAEDTPAETEQDIQEHTAAEAVEDAYVSVRFEQVDQPEQPRPEQKSGPDLDQIGSMLDKAGRGIATAIGPLNGDDEVVPPLSPVDMNQVSQELLSALGAAMSGHPRSVIEMLNIERRPDPTNEVAFVPEMRIEHGQDMAVGY